MILPTRPDAVVGDTPSPTGIYGQHGGCTHRIERFARLNTFNLRRNHHLWKTDSVDHDRGGGTEGRTGAADARPAKRVARENRDNQVTRMFVVRLSPREVEEGWL